MYLIFLNKNTPKRVMKEQVMNKKEIMEEIEKFDINNVEFNYDSISPWKILELSPKLHQTFEKLDSKRFSKKRREFISLFLNVYPNG